MRLSRALSLSLLCLLPVFGQDCPPVNFAQASHISGYADDIGALMAHELDGSYSRHRYSNVLTALLGMARKIDTTTSFERSFGSCAGVPRTFKLPPSWQWLAFQTGLSSTNPVFGRLNEQGVGFGVFVDPTNSNTAYAIVGNADGSYQLGSTLNVTNNAVTFLIQDFNGDRKGDLAVFKFGNGASDAGGVAIYKGNGDGTFAPSTTFPAGRGPEGGVVADLNGDGKLDIAVANYFSTDISILLGNGDGTFKAPASYPLTANSFAVAVGDFNGDNKPDLVATALDNSKPVVAGSVFLLLNRGDGTFQPAKEILSGTSPRGLATGDYNKDGLTDLIVTDNQTRTVTLMLGNGSGGFSSSSTYQAIKGPPMAVDVDGDGNLDVVVAAGHPDFFVASLFDAISGTTSTEQFITILFGKGDGTLLAAPTFNTGQTPSAIASGDFNGDARPDLVVASSGSRDLWFLEGRGAGAYLAPKQFTIPGARPAALAAARFDSDSITDLAVADAAANRVHVLFGRTSGSFAAPVSYPTGGTPSAVLAADLNGDGKPDLAVASSTSPSGINLFLNNGNGTFNPGQTLSAGKAPASLTSSDFNGDGKPDLVVADPSTGLQFLTGNGDGTFQAAQLLSAAGAPALVVAGDLNSDGKPDLVAAGSTPGSPFASILLGAGDGTFSDPKAQPFDFAPSALAIADFNGDGRSDLAIATCCDSEARVKYLLGNGDGTFQEALPIRGGNAHRALLTEDLNADGKPDLVVADAVSTSNGTVTILLNSTTALTPSRLTTQNGASFLDGPIAPDSLAAASGAGLASGSAAAGLQAPSTPYPTELGGTTVTVKDSSGVEIQAPIASVSDKLVTYLLPAGVALGPAAITVKAASGAIAAGQADVASVSPGVFLRAPGIPLGSLVRTQGDSTSAEEISTESDGVVSLRPIDLGPGTDVVTLYLMATGIRGRSSLEQVSIEINGLAIAAADASPITGYPGFDSLSFILPRELAGAGEVTINIKVDGQPANPVKIVIQ